MFDYEQIKKALQSALLSGSIDIIYYHMVCKQIDDINYNSSSTHTYRDESISYLIK